jgi:hypothetical protein
MEENKRIKLEYPIPVKDADGKEIMCSEISVPPRIKAKHIRKMPREIFEGKDITPDKVIDLIVVLTGLPDEAVEEIDFTDLANISEELGGFLADSLDRIGKN